MKNDEIMITVKFENKTGDDVCERYMTFLVVKDITLRDFIEGVYYGLKSIKKENSPDIVNGSVSDNKCFEILDTYLKTHSEIAVNHIFKNINDNINSNGIIDFCKKIDEKPVYDFSLSELGIVTSSCILITDSDEVTLESLFDSENINSYIIKGDSPEYNISTRNITSVESSVVDINPAGNRPVTDQSGMGLSLIGSLTSIGLSVGVRFLVNNSTGRNMALMTLAMGAVSCITMLLNIVIQNQKSKKAAEKWQSDYENYITELIRKILKFQSQDILYLNTTYPSADKMFNKVKTLNGSIFERSQNDSDFMTVSLGGSEQIEPLFTINAEKKDKVEEDNIRYELLSKNNKYMPFDFKIIVPNKKSSSISSNMPYLSELAYNFANHTAKGEGGISGFKYLKDYHDSENKPPLLLELKNCGALGVLSEDYSLMLNFVRYMIFELSFYHSPENIQFVFFFRKNENICEQTQIISNYRYLPHANELFENRSQFIFDKKSAGEAFSQLFSIVNQRKGEHESDGEDAEKSDSKYTQIVCVVFDDYDIKETAFSRFLPEAPEQDKEFQNTLGLSFIFLQDDRDKLPKYCGNIVELLPDSGTLRKRYNIIEREMLPDEKNIVSSEGYISEKKTFENKYIFTSEYDIEYENAYRRLSSIYYKRIEENGKVPSKVSLFEVWNIKNEDVTDDVSASNVCEKIKQLWDTSNVTKGLSVPIGMNERGVTFLDMHQKGDGPHGLVAGTTGSGKSETLLTYVIGCCMKYRPEELNFMLIDMKGGGFSDRLGKLPHLVGSVTNTTGESEGISSEYMLKRFLYILNAEITEREVCLKNLNTDNIDDYIDARKEAVSYRNRIIQAQGDEVQEKAILDEIDKKYKGKNKDNFCKACNPYETAEEPKPLAHLLLIVDEFTELKRFSSDSNGIDFIKDITTIARVGRTLGFHIILVSQNIEGAITDDIRVNSKARICLRVATKGASKDMIGTADAASPKMPYNGRAYILVGERYEYFQSAFTGDNRNMTLKKPVNVTRVSETGAYNTDFYKSDKNNERLKQAVKQVDKNDNQLNYIVNAVNSVMEKYKDEYKYPNKLFLDPLPADEKSVTDKTEWEKMPDGKIICTVGKYDIPVLQNQYDFQVDLLKSNIILFGSTQSGKSNLIRLIINILHKTMDVDNEEIFILDFDGSLSAYKDMPLVSAYFDNSNEEYVKRVFKILENRLKENSAKLSGVGFSKNSSCKLPHTTFFIDNFNAFLDEPRYFSYQEKLARLCRDGISKGITVIVTASETKGTGSFMNNFSQKIAVNLNDEKYSEIFGVKTGNIGKIAGRGFANVTEKPGKINRTFNVNCPYEMHCSFAEDIKSPVFREELNKKFNYIESQGFKKQVRKYQTFNSKLIIDDFVRLTGKPETDFYSAKESDYEFIAGLDYVNFKPVMLNFKQSRFLAVYSKRDFGREEFIERIVERLMTVCSNRKLVLFDDGRQQLDGIREKYKERRLEYISRFKEVEVSCGDSVAKPKPNQQRTDEEKFRGYVLNSSGKESALQIKKIKLSPMQLFYKYIHENCVDIGKYISKISGITQGCSDLDKDSTVFIIQSKLAYSAVPENKLFINCILPMLADIAEERDYIFIFSDVKKMADITINEKFNALIRSTVVFDNIAEFVAERGQKTVMGDMEINALKADYAKCEKGDGYYYDVEADNLTKLKFIQKEDEENG